MTDPWVHVLTTDETCRGAERRLAQIYPDAKLRRCLDGRAILDLPGFYEAVEKALPLIAGFGRNLDALIDLFRTIGYSYAGKPHAFLWYRPEVMMRAAPCDFRQVVDVIVGATKELLVGEETNPGFTLEGEQDWMSTRVDVVFACSETVGAEEVAAVASRLSEDWANDFHSLEVEVDRLAVGW